MVLPPPGPFPESLLSTTARARRGRRLYSDICLMLLALSRQRPARRASSGSTLLRRFRQTASAQYARPGAKPHALQTFHPTARRQSFEKKQGGYCVLLPGSAAHPLSGWCSLRNAHDMKRRFNHLGVVHDQRPLPNLLYASLSRVSAVCMTLA